MFRVEHWIIMVIWYKYDMPMRLLNVMDDSSLLPSSGHIAVVQ